MMLRRMGRATGLLGASLALLMAVVVAAGGCITPPVILPAPQGPLDPSRFPPHAQLVDVPVGEHEVLRGVWVPADAPDAPVMLDFLESSGSLVTGARSNSITGSATFATDDAPMLDECGAQGVPPETAGPSLDPARQRLALLPLLGFSALCLDYTGVGASDGERSPDNLRRDAHAAWDEALRRTGGDSSRVILHGTSIGALAVAALLQDGAQPGAVILVAPVSASSVGVNGARVMRGPWTAALLGWLLRAPVDVDLLAELRRTRPPLLVIVPETDEFFTHDERVELLACVSGVGGTFVVRHPDHIALALASRDVMAAEEWFLARLWPAQQTVWPDLPNVLAQAELSPAERRQLLDLLAWLPDDARSHVDLATLARLADFSDPAGRLPVEHLLALRGRVHDLAGCPAAMVVDRLAEAAANPPQVYDSMSISVTGEVTRPDEDSATALAGWVVLTSRNLVEHGLAESDAHRQVLRLALRAAAIPDRVTTDAAGLPEVDVLVDGAWQPLALAGWAR
jgi:hypothetical protein